MKKLFSVAFTAFIMLGLCGCNSPNETDSRYIVSAIGFDFEGEMLTVSTETLIVSNRNEDSPKRKIFTSSAKTPEKALLNMSGLLAKEFAFDHCGVVIIGDGADKEAFDGIIKFCKEKRSLNLAVLMVRAKSAAELLKCEPTATFSTGYDIMSILEQKNKPFKNMFYEIEAMRLEKGKTEITLPYFAIDEHGFTLSGESNAVSKGADIYDG